jgi:AcrR family transcriptional regulator
MNACFGCRLCETLVELDERLDDPDRVLLSHKVVEILRKQNTLPPILTLDQALHQPRRYRRLPEFDLSNHATPCYPKVCYVYVCVEVILLTREISEVQLDPHSKSSRRPRSDGQRNRLRLIDAAKRVFAEKGRAASLEQVAREADVSIASLYRHFPTRDAVITAVYRQEVDALIEAADRLVAERQPIAALREWLMLFVEFLDAKHGMADAMDTLMGGPENLYSKTPDRLASPITALVTYAVETGALQSDIEPLDLLRALSGVATIRVSENWKRSAGRIVDLLLAGMTAKAGGHGG